MKFSEMKYERIDSNEIIQKLNALSAKMKNAATYEDAKKVYVLKDQEDRHVRTMMTLVNIRHSIDTRDKFYEEENNYWNHVTPLIQEAAIAWTKTVLESPFRKELEEEFGDVTFLNAEMDLRSFTPELIPLLQEENKLTDEYEVLLSSAQIPFNGKVYTLSQLTPFKNALDDEVRLAAWKAEGKWYKEHQDKMDEIYDKLVHLRDQMGKMLGYENYIPLGYDRMNRNCFHKEDVAKFRAAVVKYLVPIASDIYKAQAKRIGKSYPLSYADAALSFRSGNPTPKGTPEEILEAGLKFYNELSPETSEFFNVMMDNELLDVKSTEGKQAGGYCTGLPDYEVPFIFANFNGTQHDVEVVTHEAGHAFACYVNRKRIPLDTIWPSMESCEVHSMSMEFFAWPWAELFFKEDTRKYLYSHLAGAVTFIPYGTLVDHYQHEVYEHPEYTPKERHAVWKRLQGVYMPWMKLDGEIPFYADGEAWQRQHHIYSSPFYYIDYCLAQTVALEFWKMIQEDQKNAWEHYMAYTRMGGSKVFTELLRNADLLSPFEEETLKGICEAAKKFLDEYDLTGIE